MPQDIIIITPFQGYQPRHVDQGGPGRGVGGDGEGGGRGIISILIRLIELIK